MLRQLTLALVAFTATLPAQAILNVPSQYPTVQIAIGAAQNGDTVLVAPGVYVGPVDFLGKDITVKGDQGASSTTIQGTGGSPVVTFASGESTSSVLEGFTLTGGGASGVFITDASPIVRDCRIAGNVVTGSGGGGIRCQVTNGNNGSPFITGCHISGNITDRAGGGVFCNVDGGGTGQITLQGCTLENNSATAGASSYPRGGGAGAFYSVDATASLVVTIADCVVTANTAADRGGGFTFEEPSLVNVTSCRIANNVSGGGPVGGGGVWSTATQLNVTNCLVVGNSAADAGGGLAIATANTNTNYAILNCSIAGNTAPGVGGLYLLGPTSGTVSGSIVFGNAGVSIGGTTGYGLSVTFSAVDSGFFASNPTNISDDPQFVDPASGDYHLASSSPCVDAGGPPAASLPPLDVDGTARIVNGLVDMGADELPAAQLPGTMDALDLYTYVNGEGDPHADVLTVNPGDLLSAHLKATDGSLAGYPPLIVGQGFATGNPPAANPGLGDIHISLITPYTVVVGSLPPHPLLTPGLSPTGLAVFIAVPPGLSGTSVRLQGFVVAPIAANGQYGATRAHDIVFQ